MLRSPFFNSHSPLHPARSAGSSRVRIVPSVCASLAPSSTLPIKQAQEAFSRRVTCKPCTRYAGLLLYTWYGMRHAFSL